eukprot:GHVU01118810.1.p2 GENE.GHVU01118810.1~~GHVU01118810.1.p2  ORF type:complete len:167 (+),score=22.28 GHVU01118810.1:54-554(+)
MMMGMRALAEIETITATTEGIESPGKTGLDYVTGVEVKDILYEIVLRKTTVEMETAGTIIGEMTIAVVIIVVVTITAEMTVAGTMIAVVKMTTVAGVVMEKTITMVTQTTTMIAVEITVPIVDAVVVAVEVPREEITGNHLERICELRKKSQSLARRHQLVTLPGE